MGAIHLAGLHASAEPAHATLPPFTLDDKYTLRSGRIYLSGIQALVRLPLTQKWRDEAVGLHTAGYISGYRGAPLACLDQALWAAHEHLQTNSVRFQPGINEQLALTAVWGTQQVALIGRSRHDGIFGMWYAKGQGLDRSLDVLKHANHAGTSRHGGVVLVVGDDHGAQSSALPHQSEHTLSAAMVPTLHPGNVQECLDLGLHGWAISRFSGCFVGLKALADTVESHASVDADPYRVRVVLPDDFAMPEGGLNCRPSTDTLRPEALRQEALMQDYKIQAALAYARANRLNRTTIDSPAARLGIVASGKAYFDVLEALQELGIGEREAMAIGLRLFKVSLPWPLEPHSIRAFAGGLEEILVVEEKRQIVEYQLKEQLYNWREDVRPRIIGKFDEKGEWTHPQGQSLLPSKGDFSVAQIARVIAARVARFHRSDMIEARLRLLAQKEVVQHKAVATPERSTYYCAGCPHNSSTRVPAGSLALAGVGCHVMATAIFPDQNKFAAPMGNEGAAWIGQAPYLDRDHVFANLGDGTYFHSGSLAIRAAVASGLNITYKILFNDAVALAGGQPVEGQLTVQAVVGQLRAEGVRKIVVLTDDLSRYEGPSALPSAVSLFDRHELDRVQRELRKVKGTSVLIYDQTCAAEKRRRRKKNAMPDPAPRLFINEAVCEGCGDCGTASNCAAVLPLETPLGRKRTIDQASCNRDYTCASGFCPSFVTVIGGTLRKSAPLLANPIEVARGLPLPSMPPLDQPWNIFATGIGGSGVITLGTLIGTAAHLEGRNASVLDVTGMPRNNGVATSHIRIAQADVPLHAQRIPTGEADLILGCDLLTAASREAVSRTRPGRSRAVVNLRQQPVGLLAQEPDRQFPLQPAKALLGEALAGAVEYIDAHRLASTLLGEPVLANVVLLGFAWQRGRVPVGQEALLRAIEINGVAVLANQTAFALGRRLAVQPEWVDARLAKPVLVPARNEPLDDLIARHIRFLRDYQDVAYAESYRSWVAEVSTAEMLHVPEARHLPLTRAAALGLFQLMTYKDEYEVARLYTRPEFLQTLRQNFEGIQSLRFSMALPLIARKDAQGHPVKSEYGGWILPTMWLLARMRGLRGTALDIFGYTQERRMERGLIQDFRTRISHLLHRLTPENHAQAVRIAQVAHGIRGYGHIKYRSVEVARAAWAALDIAATD